ncbi:MAG: GTPase HflX [Acidimicrobiia bacterium]|nr:MAG: GTPase HflX [Acidimicrobiia bacterium]
MSDFQETRMIRQRKGLTASVTDLDVSRQRAMLIGLVRSKSDRARGESSLVELALLTDTAGSDPVEAELVRRERPDPATFIGKGKLAELVALSHAEDIDVVVFDNELSPAQQRNLHQAFKCDVVDRVALILDIFAQHAHTKEGMLQVELAQHRYRLPRLKGQGTQLSRLGAGIGTRGPGETKLETDRRRILERVRKIERELKDASQSRATRNKNRKRSGEPAIAIVGYTNAGKSTLFNRLTDADVLVEDRLFATLDSTVRQLSLPHGHDAVISDTVGFVRDLPHELVKAFMSTLEEVGDADLLVHLVDASDPDPDHQLASVRRVLQEIGADDVDELVAFNKIDAASDTTVRRLRSLHPDAIFISAATGAGIDDLLDAIVDGLHAKTVELSLLIPYENGDVLAEAHSTGDVLGLEHLDAGTSITVRIPHASAARFRRFVDNPPSSVLPSGSSVPPPESSVLPSGGTSESSSEGGLRAREPGTAED